METQMENRPKFIWDGAVGVKIKEQTNRQTGDIFHSFEFVRCYKTADSDEMKYASSFTERNSEALGRVIAKTLQFIAESKVADVPSTEPDKQVLGKIGLAKVPEDQAVRPTHN